jgi:hypothetical protein
MYFALGHVAKVCVQRGCPEDAGIRSSVAVPRYNGRLCDNCRVRVHRAAGLGYGCLGGRKVTAKRMSGAVWWEYVDAMVEWRLLIDLASYFYVGIEHSEQPALNR